MKEVLQRIGSVEEKVDNLEVRFDNLEVRMDRLETRMDNLEVRMDRLEEKVDNLKKELHEEIVKGDAELKQEIQYLKLDLNQKYNDLREAIFYLENSLGGKLDTICDFIKVQMEKNKENSQNFSQFDKKIETNELRILNHEDRIKFLEKKLNRAN